MKNASIRLATVDDAEALLSIYSHYVTNTAISFEYTVPSTDEFRERIRRITAKYPYLVLIEEGKIVGYAYAGSFVGRAAYDWCAESTIYLAPEVCRCGYGKMLYEALENHLRQMGIRNLYACIGVPDAEDEYLNSNSAEFHEHMGFKRVGLFYKCGYKFGRWYHMIWCEKILAPHDSAEDVIPFPQLNSI